jgi:hypothetical protein
MYNKTNIWKTRKKINNSLSGIEISQSYYQKQVYVSFWFSAFTKDIIIFWNPDKNL